MQPWKQILAAAVVALAGSQAWAGGVSDSEIVIGTHIDLSGPAAGAMPMLRNAMQLRLDEANAAGGVNGRKLRLVVEDNGSQPQLGVRAVQKLIKSDDVFAIINPFGSGPNAATAKMAADAGVVVFAPWGASALIRKASGNHPLVFTTVQDYDDTTSYGLSWGIKTWNAKKVGLIYQEGPFGDLVKAGVDKALKNAGLTLAAEAAYKLGDIDFSSQVARMKAAGVDIIVAGTVIRETVGVAAEVKKLGWTDVKVLTTLPGRSSVVAMLGKDATEGIYGIGGWKLHAPDTTDPEARKFMTSFKARFNAEPDENAANAYSYTDWFVKGMTAAGRNLTAQSFAEAVRKIQHQDFTTYGRQTLVNNHVDPEMASVDQIKGGKWVAVAPPMSSMVK